MNKIRKYHEFNKLADFNIGLGAKIINYYVSHSILLSKE